MNKPPLSLCLLPTLATLFRAGNWLNRRRTG
jgi:hypothetical protein